MKKTLFLVFSGAIVIFSIITICSAPIINKILPNSDDWKTHNCKYQSDILKNLEKTHASDDSIKSQKKKRNQCNREKAMYGLEFSSLILDVILGAICTILGLLHYFDVANLLKNGYIFTNDVAYRKFDRTGSPIFKLNGEWVFAEKQDGNYKCIYFKKDKENSIYAKYNDLGKKQYNYEKKRHYDNAEYTKCELNKYNVICDAEGNVVYTNTLPAGCDKFYLNLPSDDYDNKYLFDRWITSIIFSCFIYACCIGLAIFGFFLFKSDGSGI